MRLGAALAVVAAGVPSVSSADIDLLNLVVTPARADDLVDFVGLGVTSFGNDKTCPGSKMWPESGEYIPRNLNFDILGLGKDTKYLVFQKASNEYLSALWQDTTALDRVTGAILVPPWDAVTIKLRGRTKGTFELYYPVGSDDWTYHSSPLSHVAAGGSVTIQSVNIGNWVSVVSIKP